MAVTHQGVYVQTPRCGVQNILPADTTTKKTVVTAGANGTKLVALSATSSDTNARVIQMTILRSAVSYLIGSTSVPAASGSDGATPSTNMLANCTGLPIDNDGQRYLFLESGDVLQVNSTTNVTAAKEIDLSATLGDF